MQNKLQAVFTKEELEFKVQASGTSNGKTWVLVATYVQARAIQERLDNCFGFDGWSVAYRETPSGVICRLKVLHEGREIIKEDGAELTGKIGGPNALKGGCSGALKRAASSGFGIGRYLYTLPKLYAQAVQKNKPSNTEGWHNSKLKSGEFVWWQEPILPHWAYTNECDKQPLPTTTVIETAEPLKTVTTPQDYLIKLNKHHGDIISKCLDYYGKPTINLLAANEINSVIKKVEKITALRAN